MQLLEDGVALVRDRQVIGTDGGRHGKDPREVFGRAHVLDLDQRGDRLIIVDRKEDAFPHLVDRIVLAEQPAAGQGAANLAECADGGERQTEAE